LESLTDLSDKKEDITDTVQVVETNTVKVPSKGSSPVPVQTAEKSTVRNTIPFFE